MAVAQTIGSAETAPPQITIRRIDTNDIKAALRAGLADFRRHRGDILFIGILYPLIGIVSALVALRNDGLPLIFPLAAGLSLLGPLVSTGFYEIARRQDAGLESNWSHFFDVVKRPSFSSIMFVGVLLIGLFVAWIISAALIYGVFLGPQAPGSIGALLGRLFGSPEGWTMMIVGDLVGLGFAIIVLAVSVISLPMLVDDGVDAGTAIRTSVAAVSQNPVTMAKWGLTVAVLLVLGSIPVFLGLAVVLPVVGYATWHLYTRTIDRSGR